MITIDAQQAKHFTRVANVGFAIRLAASLRDEHPDVWGSVSERDAVLRILNDAEVAVSLGFVTELGVARIVELMSLIDGDFGARPEHRDALMLVHEHVTRDNDEAAEDWDSLRELVIAMCKSGNDDGEER